MTQLEAHARLADLIATWNVAVERTSETEASFLAFGTRGRQAVVLKVVKRDGDEWRSGEILEAFRGNGAVRVYEHTPGAVLLERASPGEQLVNVAEAGHDVAATEIIADAVEQMQGSIAPERCATVRDWAVAFPQYVASGDTRIPTRLVEDAGACYAQLAESQRQTRLLHGDLQHYNVLRDFHRGWLAIDPKGVVGEVEYEIGAMLRNPIGQPDLFTSPKTIEGRINYVVRRLNLDIDRVVRWAFAQAVLSAIWEIEDGFTVDARSPLLLLAVTLQMMMHDRQASS